MPDQSRETAPLLLSALSPGLEPDDRAGETASVPAAAGGQAVVPDVSGLGARTATRRLAQASLEPELRGSGRAVGQSPRAGAIVKRGARVKVILAPPG